MIGRNEQFGIGPFPFLQEELGAPVWVSSIGVSSTIVLGAIATLVVLFEGIFRPTRRELIIALFTGFFVVYWVLAIFGTSFPP